MGPLTDKLIVVTGVSSGIGCAMVHTFIENGAHVIGVGRREPPPLPDSFKASSFMFLRGDVGEQSTIDLVAETATKSWGHVDVLVNNAATLLPPTPIGDLTPDDWDRVLQINLLSVVRLSTRLLPLIRSSRTGRVINVGSVLSMYAAPLGAPYVASKHALLGLTRTQALEYGPLGITANCILPGGVDTEMFRRGDPDGEFRRHVESRCPLKRMADPREIAAVAVFLASSLSSYINGHASLTDGGLTVSV